MATDRGPQWSIQDKNQFPALIGHSGTAGTATTQRVVVTDGAVHSFVSGGTVSTDSVEVTGFNGGSVAVGSASAVELTFTGVTQGIKIDASNENSGTIYVGNSGVDNEGGSAIFGELLAGESLSIDINDASAPIYICSSAASQKAWKTALT